MSDPVAFDAQYRGTASGVRPAVVSVIATRQPCRALFCFARGNRLLFEPAAFLFGALARLGNPRFAIGYLQPQGLEGDGCLLQIEGGIERISQVQAALG